LFLLAIVVSQSLRPDLEPAKDFLSEYAVDAFGFVMAAGFAVLGVGILLLSAGLRQYGSVTRYGKVGVIFLGVSGMAMLGVAVFPVEVDPVEPSLTAQLHDLSALIHFLSITAGALLIALDFRHDSRWHQYVRSETVLAVASLLAFILFFTVYPLQAGSEPPVQQLRPVIGIFQRTLIFFIWLWLTATAIRLRRLTEHEFSDP
jgi:hypothetical membrane protein